MWAILVVAAVLLGAEQDPAVLASRSGNADRTASVRGVVVKAESGTPLPRVTLFLAAQGGGRWEAITDDGGAFEFTGLPSGRFSIVARKRGASRGSLPLTLTSGQRLEQVTIPLLRGGAITGRIVDGSGEPLVEATVRALRTEYIAGGRRLRTVATAQTDDRGQYSPCRRCLRASTVWQSSTSSWKASGRTLRTWNGSAPQP